MAAQYIVALSDLRETRDSDYIKVTKLDWVYPLTNIDNIRKDSLYYIEDTNINKTYIPLYFETIEDDLYIFIVVSHPNIRVKTRKTSLQKLISDNKVYISYIRLSYLLTPGIKDNLKAKEAKLGNTIMNIEEIQHGKKYFIEDNSGKFISLLYAGDNKDDFFQFTIDDGTIVKTQRTSLETLINAKKVHVDPRWNFVNAYNRRLLAQMSQMASPLPEVLSQKPMNGRIIPGTLYKKGGRRSKHKKHQTTRNKRNNKRRHSRRK